ncbi:Mss4-like protein [Ephemerocybe angulata]|uniref:Mss4-like protein n=1 Tax=Ephemerocybe angulata TaxID=980116 RepID=A0A8H6HEF1_9AGAR|nr:Mss4-like protein [Tulosesus angulatus]KAF6745396.1 Mss4-like protein [Tulosesus angulatus]
MPTTVHGHCLCRETLISVDNIEDYQDHRACHCADCKRTCGGAFSTSVIVPKRHIHYTGPIKEFTYLSRVPNGRVVTRVFCGTCGSCVAFRSPVFRDMEAVFTGLIPYFSTVPIKIEIWTKDRWNCISQFTEASQHKIVEGYSLPKF